MTRSLDSVIYFSPMNRAFEIIHVPPDYHIWQTYEPTVKAELFSTAIRIDRTVAVVDPIPLAANARASLGNVETILITNSNHARAAKDFASDSLFVPKELANDFPKSQPLADGIRVHGLTVIALPGAAPGEFAFYDARDGGTLIVGDALINFEPHNFTLLPAKYCVDRKQMIRSLRILLDFPFVRVFFAHGAPVVSGARDRLAALLDAFA